MGWRGKVSIRLGLRMSKESVYFGKFDFNGNLRGAGKFIGGAMSLYGPDGEFHYRPEYDKWYYEGDFDEITDEQFAEFKKKMDAKKA